MIDIYSPIYDGEEYTEFERFLLNNRNQSDPQLKSFFDAIVAVIDKIRKTGARENYFRQEGGNVKAVPIFISFSPINKAIGKMRLYCLRLSDRILIIGNGGVTKEQKYQNDPQMNKYVEDLRFIDNTIKYHRQKSRPNNFDYTTTTEIIQSITI